MKLKRIPLLMVLIISLAMILIACSNEKSDDESKENEQESDEEDDMQASEASDPFTLEIGVHFDEEMFNERFKEPIEEQFDYITVEQVDVFTYGRSDLEELFSSGGSPDIFFTLSQSDMEHFRIDQDLDELLEKHDVDLSNINENLLDTIRARDSEGRLLAWPYEDTYYVLLYNKEIFDLLGESYPSDDMTWKETISLASKMTREIDGVQYRGLDFADDVLLSQFSVNATDPETGDVLIQKEPEFAQYLDLYKDFIDIPGLFNEDDQIFDNDHRFTSDRNTAMLMVNSQAITWYDSEDFDDLDFDIAAVPTWENRPGIAPAGFIQTLTLNPDSDYVDDVIEVFAYLASSEYQTWMSKNGIGIISDEKEILDEFYKDYEYTHDKNIEAIFKNDTPPPVETMSIWDEYVDISVQDFFESDQTDVNTFLRKTAEESEEKIRQAKESE